MFYVHLHALSLCLILIETEVFFLVINLIIATDTVIHKDNNATISSVAIVYEYFKPESSSFLLSSSSCSFIAYIRSSKPFRLSSAVSTISSMVRPVSSSAFSSSAT